MSGSSPTIGDTLLHLRYNPEHVAGRGLHGEGSNRTGSEGADADCARPIGTQIFDHARMIFCSTWMRTARAWRAARGGRGGFGNAHFATSN